LKPPREKPLIDGIEGAKVREANSSIRLVETPIIVCDGVPAVRREDVDYMSKCDERIADAGDLMPVGSLGGKTHIRAVGDAHGEVS
jgi:hypothetical protein